MIPLNPLDILPLHVQIFDVQVLFLFFQKQIILPLVIKKGHNGYIIQSIFSQARLV